MHQANQQTTQAPSTARTSIRRHLIVAGLAVILLLGGVGGWSALSHINGAVMAVGSVVIEGNVKRVQHREGGIVGAIRVDDGDRVAAGAVLVTLDATTTRANLAIIENQIDQLSARRMRLVAEREGAQALQVPQTLALRADQPEISELIEGETALFEARRRTLQGQRWQLRERIRQVDQESDGLSARLAAKDDEIDLVTQELEGVNRLYDQGMIPFPRVAELRRMRAQLAGERGQLVAEIARAATRIAETELQILQLDEDRLSETLTELREVEAQMIELGERRVAALDELARVEIRAPQDGYVHELAVHTVGGVIGPGETVMTIVPDAGRLLVEARIEAVDIDQIAIGQIATLRLSAFNQRTTSEIEGRIRTVSADLSRDPQTGEAWYLARIDIEPQELARLNGLALLPGMPVEAFVQTGERTPLSYILKPLADHIARAMREE
ncbi:MAG TPA: HlyD family type I secretion periplasmic adaptor subunit [Saliniramus sp.]|nr:HlyD family type I secretion periplasmic adaptor subunit [Saliniramus sp.]